VKSFNSLGLLLRGDEAVAQAEKLKPDIAIVDISMPGLNGLEAARKIREVWPHTEILILTMHHSDQLISGVVEAGVRGYIVNRIRTATW
jgi:DNA-binding NarL/FixJ family response regulator